MGELPDKQDGEQRHRRPFNVRPRRRPAQQRAHGAGERPDEGGQGGEALERRVDGHITERGEQRQRYGEQVGAQQQPHCAQRERAQPGQNARRQREPAASQRTLCGADHARVGLPFQSFVQRARARRNQADAEQGVEQAGLHAGDAGLHRGQVKPSPAGDQHHANHLHLEQLAQVVDERGGGSGAGRVQVRRPVRMAFSCGCGQFCLNCGLGGGCHVRVG